MQINFDKTSSLIGKRERMLVEGDIQLAWLQIDFRFRATLDYTARKTGVRTTVLRCVLFNNDGDDIDDEVYTAACNTKKKEEKKKTRSRRRETRASQIERNCCFSSFQLEDVMREKKKEICDLRTGQIVSAAGHKLSY